MEYPFRVVAFLRDDVVAVWGSCSNTLAYPSDDLQMAHRAWAKPEHVLIILKGLRKQGKRGVKTSGSLSKYNMVSIPVERLI